MDSVPIFPILAFVLVYLQYINFFVVDIGQSTQLLPASIFDRTVNICILYYIVTVT